MSQSKVELPEGAKPKLDKSVWALLFVVGTAFMASRYDFQLSTLALPQFQKTFGYDDQMSVLIGTIAKIGAIPAVLLTFMADRIGRKPLFLWAIIGFSVAAIVVATAQNVVMLTIGLFLTRMFTMVDELLAVVLLAEAAPRHARAWMLGLLSFIGASGDGTALIAYGIYADVPESWRWMYAAGAVPAVLSIFWRVGLPESAAFVAARDQGQVDPFKAIGTNIKPVLIMALAYFLFWLPISPALTYPSLYLEPKVGWTPSAISTLLFLSGLVGLIGTFLGGFLADKLGRRPVAIGATLICVAGLSGLYLNQDKNLMGAFYSIGLVAWFAATVALRALMTEMVPTEARATVAGTSEIGATIGAVSGGLLVAHLIPLVGGTGPAIVAVMPVVVIAAIAIWFLPETNGRRIEGDSAH